MGFMDGVRGMFKKPKPEETPATIEPGLREAGPAAPPTELLGTGGARKAADALIDRNKRMKKMMDEM